MLVVRTTCKNKKEAEKIATLLVRAKLAACAAFFPATSVFFWQKKFCRECEFILEIKCSEKNYAKVEEKIRALHSYSLPQIIAFKVSRASKEYKKWVEG